MLRKFKILFVIASVIALATSAYAFSLKELANYPREKLRDVLVSQLSAALGREISIGSLKGNLYQWLILNDVVVASGRKLTSGAFIRAKRVEIRFSLVKTIFSGGNILPYIKKVKVIEPEILVERTGKDTWLGIDLAESAPSSSNGKPLLLAQPLNMEVTVENGYGRYLDWWGWKEFGRIDRPFSEKFTSFNFEAKTGKDNKVLYQGSLDTRQNNNRIDISGSIDLQRPAFDLRVKALALPVAYWVSYIVPVKEMQFLGGLADLDLRMSPRTTPWHRGESQVELDLSIKVDKGMLRFPYLFKKPFQKVQGEVRLDTYGLSLKNLKGEVEGTPVQWSGRINAYEKATVAMKVRTLEQADLSRGRDFMAALVPYDLRGRGDVAIDFTGPIEAQKITGKIAAENGSVWRIPFQKADLIFDLYKDTFDFQVKDAQFSGGSANLQGSSDLKQQKISFKFFGNDLKVQELLGQVPASGNLDLLLKGEGPLAAVKMTVQITGNDCVVQAQNVDKGLAELTLRPGKIFFDKAKLGMNTKELHFSGWVGVSSNFEIVFPSQNISVQRIADWGGLEFAGELSGNVSGKFQGEGEGVPAPTLADLRFKLSGALQDATFGNEPLAVLKGAAQWDGQAFTFQDLIAAKKHSFFKGSGSFSDAGNMSLNVQDGSSIELAEWQNIQRYFSTLVSGRLSFTGKAAAVKDVYDLAGKTSLQNFSLGSLTLAELTGEVLVTDNVLQADKLALHLGGDNYILQGFCDLKPLYSREKNPYLNFAVDVNTTHADINDLYLFLRAFRKELINKNTLSKGQAQEAEASGTKEQRTLAELTMDRYWPLLRNFETEGTLLGAYLGLQQEEGQRIQEEESTVFSWGKNAAISGRFFFSLQNRRPKFEADLTFRELDLGAASFQKARLRMDTDQQGVVNTKLAAEEGRLLDGAFRSLEIAALYQKENLVFQKASLRQEDEVLDDFIRGSLPLSPWWDKSRADLPVDLDLKFTGDYLGLLSLLIKNIRTIRNEGEVILHLGGTLSDPSFSAKKIDLKNAAISFTTGNIIHAPLLVQGSALSLLDNRLQVERLDLSWTGEETGGVTNNITVSGNINLARLNFLRPETLETALDLELADTELELRLPDLYQGKLATKKAGLKGSYIFPISKQSYEDFLKEPELMSYPVFRGEVLAKEGSFYMQDQAPQNYLPLGLDLSLIIGRNLNIIRGKSILQARDIRSLQDMFTYFDLSLLESRSTPLQLTGTLQRPLLKGTVYFEEGNLALFGRSFMLIDKETQRRYFGAKVDRLQDNRVDFQLAEQNNAVVPVARFNLVAQTTIEVPEEATVTFAAEEAVPTETATIWKERDYLAEVNGPLEDLSAYSFERYDLESGLPKLEGEAYVLKDPRTGENIRAERLRELTLDLAPSVLKSAYTSLADGQEFDSKTALREVSRTQVNILARSVLRPIERNIATRVGLYDLRLRHDFGKDFTTAAGLEREALYPGTELQPAEWEQVAGLDMIAELMRNRLYLTLNTSIDQGLARKYWDFRFASYRLTWYLFREVVFDEISLNYANDIVFDPNFKETISLEILHNF